MNRILYLGVLLVVLISLGFLAGANNILAKTNCPICPPDQQGGVVPCGRDCNDPTTDWNECKPCKLCHFFIMFDRIVDFVLFTLVPPIAVLMFVIGGVMFFLTGGSPESVNRAKSILTATIIGLLIVYGAWLLLNAFFTIIGVAEWTGLQEGWFNYPCP
jgi:hypothetical protein